MNGVAFYLFGKPIFWYGIIIALGVLIGIYMAMKYAKTLGYDQEMIIDFCLLAIPFAIVGARLYYVVFSWGYYSQYPLDAFKIWEGGLAIFGAVIGGVVSAIIFAKKRKINFWNLADIASPSLILGQALGRWGNFFNQEAFGYIINNPKWQWFPAAVFISKTGQWHMATFFYESLWNFILFFFLLFYKKKRKKPGEIFLLYLIFYSLGRVVIEGLRTDSLYLGQFRVSQLLSAILIVFGVAMFILRRTKDVNESLNIPGDEISFEIEKGGDDDEGDEIGDDDEDDETEDEDQKDKIEDEGEKDEDQKDESESISQNEAEPEGENDQNEDIESTLNQEEEFMSKDSNKEKSGLEED